MRLAPLSLLLILAISSVACNLNREQSSLADPLDLEPDSLAYARLMAGFEKQFIAIEAEYDSADVERQADLTKFSSGCRGNNHCNRSQG